MEHVFTGTLRTARALNDPYESNELNLPLADRYSAGVLDMGVDLWVQEFDPFR